MAHKSMHPSSELLDDVVLVTGTGDARPLQMSWPNEGSCAGGVSLDESLREKTFALHCLTSIVESVLSVLVIPGKIGTCG